MMRLAALSLILLAAVVVAACGATAQANTPPEIHYGRDVADCGMIISDPRFAAAMVEPSGKAILYDDTGEVVAAAQREGLDQRRAWVHDFGTEEWIDATQALYVASDDVRTLTPMGSGLVAFKTQAAADAFRREHGGTLYRWDDVLATWRMPSAQPGQ